MSVIQIVCGGEPEGPITLYFNENLYDDQKAKLTELVLNNYTNSFSSKEIYKLTPLLRKPD